MESGTIRFSHNVDHLLCYAAYAGSIGNASLNTVKRDVQVQGTKDKPRNGAKKPRTRDSLMVIV